MNGELVFNGDIASVAENKRVLETGGGDGCTTMWMCLIAQNCTPKNG